MPRIIPPPIEGYKPWDMFERIYDHDGLGEALAWWKRTMEEEPLIDDEEPEEIERLRAQGEDYL